MNKAVVRLYSLLVALTLVGLMAWAGTDWYQLRGRAETLARESLRKTAGTITDWTIHDANRRPEVLSAIFRQGLLTEARWKALVLVSGETTTEYYWGPRTAVDPLRAVPTWAPRPTVEVEARVTVFTPSGEPWHLSGIYQFYGTAEILSLLRAAGITLLVLVVLTMVLILVQAGRREEGPAPVEDRESPPDPAPRDPEVPRTAEQEERDEYWFDDELTLEDLPPLETPPLETPPLETSSPTEGPSMLAPSGLGWAHFLDDRLTFELERCSGNNQDLTLIRFSASALDRDLSAAFSQEVQSFFSSHDLNFEAKADQPGAFIVLPARGLEQGLAEAQAFISRMDRTLPQLKVCAGAASRSGRLLSAETLIQETTSALKRARMGATRAVGLKTDPDRYREHLARQASTDESRRD